MTRSFSVHGRDVLHDSSSLSNTILSSLQPSCQRSSSQRPRRGISGSLGLHNFTFVEIAKLRSKCSHPLIQSPAVSQSFWLYLFVVCSISAAI